MTTCPRRSERNSGTAAAACLSRKVAPEKPDNFAVFTSDSDFGRVELADEVRCSSECLRFRGVALIVGGVGVMNIMLVSVTERTREIGVQEGHWRAQAGHPRHVAVHV